jgi:nucleotide-binding universal stress UspA family protein
MFRNIVWATDGSEHSERALPYALQVAESEHATLHVTHVKEKLLAGRSAGTYCLANEDEITDKITAQTAQLASEHGIATKLHVVSEARGHVAARVAEIAEQANADLIVVGTRGHSPLAELMLGSVTQGLLHEATCPVLAVPPTKLADIEPRRDAAVTTP